MKSGSDSPFIILHSAFPNTPMPPTYHLQPRAHFSAGAVLAILCAIGGMLASCSGHWFLGLVLGILAIPLGLVGLLHSVSPHIRGGIVSVLALILGVVGAVFAVLALIFKIIWFPFA
jgi:hypothetical protein